MAPTQKTPAEAVMEMGSDVNKWDIREKVWNYMEANNLVVFPRPCHNRIPNFKDSVLAGDKLTTLEEFKRAKVVKINPDKPQQHTRFLTMEANKTLLVPTPRLREGLFNKMIPPKGSNKDTLRRCSTSQGLREYSVPTGLMDKVEVDVVVIGSVAVSRTGFRIGKGEGFADLEYAMMCAMGAIHPDTVVVTTVDSCQVFDIPENLIKPHDVHVDYILTPTELIKCNRTRKQPSGIIWSALDFSKFRQVPILRQLRDMDIAAGCDVTLKEGVEEKLKLADQRREEMRQRREEQLNSQNVDGDGADRERNSYRRRRPRQFRRDRPRRRPMRTDDRSESETEGTKDGNLEESDRRAKGDNYEADDNRRRRPIQRRRRRQRRPPTIFVGGLPRSLRVSDFKAKVRENSVQPIRVIWRGPNGHAFLQFETADKMEAALEALVDLHIDDKKLRVEESKPRSERFNEDSEQSRAVNEVNEEAS
ncbi:hypothetical protein CHS0354_002861 [Potamilus streckersoni]|uniref:Methenyltetrahydrofolate synthase domain-containing protein n=1 Tax=Potamilus streckersoni TaxID=2493646 RepID=A0AAE0SMI5_9BIVA|nr:hypothetical protein CHS0354_002861 [Potamilus streckersoni]